MKGKFVCVRNLFYAKDYCYIERELKTDENFFRFEFVRVEKFYKRRIDIYGLECEEIPYVDIHDLI